MADSDIRQVQRECGACTACCEGWLESARMSMSPGKPCRHLCDARCSIYETRPANPCRNFDCGWKLPGSPMPEAMRPDRCGAIVIFGQRFREWDVVQAVPVGWQIPASTLRRIKGFVQSQQLALIYHEHEQAGGAFQRTHKIAFGPPAFMAAFREAMQAGGAEELEALSLDKTPV